MRPVCVSLTLVVAASTLRAQEPVTAPSWVPRVSLSGALDLRNISTDYSQMYLGMVGLEWRTNVRGLGLRFDGLFARRSGKNRLTVNTCGDDADCVGYPNAAIYDVYRSKVSATGAFVGATYAIERGAFRSYALGGIGAVQTRDRQLRGVKIVCAACNYITPDPTVSDGSPISGAAQLGMGATYSLRWVFLVMEARYFAVTNGIARGLNGASPLSLGLRF